MHPCVCLHSGLDLLSVVIDAPPLFFQFMSLDLDRTDPHTFLARVATAAEAMGEMA